MPRGILKLSGPMCEPAESDYWKSIHKKRGAHYNTYGLIDDRHGMDAIRLMFPDPEGVSRLNLIMFGTSGIHGYYTTLDEAWNEVKNPFDEDGDRIIEPGLVTFLIIQSRIVCTRHGNLYIRNEDDYNYLKALEAASIKAFPPEQS